MSAIHHFVLSGLTMARNNFAGVIIYVGYLRFISLRFLLCEEIIQEATQRETIDTAALGLFLCGLIQGGVLFQWYGTVSASVFQFRFKIFVFSVISYTCTNGSYSTTSATWFNYFSAYLKGIPHLRHSIVCPANKSVHSKAPNSNSSLQTSIMRDLCPL